MTVTVEDLKTPKGEFKISMFPDDESNETLFTTRLEAYLAAGEAKSTASGIVDSASFDRAVKAWATYVGAVEIYNDMLTTPNSVDVKDKEQASFSPTQFLLWEKKLEKYLADFNAEVALVSPVVEQKFSPTGAARHGFSWGGPKS